jgi:hypothetical protein
MPRLCPCARHSPEPDLTPYDARPPKVATNIPNPPIALLTGLRREWAAAMARQDFRHLDAADEELLKRDIWYGTKGWDHPFPGDDRVLHPYEVHTSPASAARGTPAVDDD